jgi:hypothetical protein
MAAKSFMTLGPTSQTRANLVDLYYKGGLLALSTNVRLDCKWLVVTNTLAYYRFMEKAFEVLLAMTGNFF